jgi:hypothetical protein
MTSLPIILDNFVEKSVQDEIEDGIFDCSWRFFNDNVYGSKNSESKYRKFENFTDRKNELSPILASNIKRERIYSKIKLIVEESCNKINFNIEKIERCYGGIHILNNKNISNNSDNIHINRNEPHLVMIYYVIDSDGDTILYDKKMGDIPNDKQYYPEKYYKFNIENRIEAKRGRILFFDGKVYHSSSTPIKTNRCIITLDLFGEFSDGSYKFPYKSKNIDKNINYQ